MKHIKITSVFLLIVILSSCSITKKAEKSIIGKWEIVTIENDSDIKPSEDYQKMLKDLIKGSYIQFNSNKTYELFLTEKKFNDTWQVSSDGIKILTSKDSIYFEIKSHAENGLSLKSVNGSKSLILILKKY